jgi:uncharacterized RDD family membrane protein YckC
MKPSGLWRRSLAGCVLDSSSCDLHIVDMSGSKISLSQSVKRNVLRFVDLFGCYLVGFVTAKLTTNQQRLGDLWATTMVVKRLGNKAQYVQAHADLS